MVKTALHSIWTANRHDKMRIPFHTHNYYELVYYVTGVGDTAIGGTRFRFQPDTYALIPPEMSHDEHHRTGSDVICLGFFCSAPLRLCFQRDEAHTVYKILKDILAETSRQAHGYRDMLEIKLNELCIQISRAGHTNTLTTRNFEYIINYIQENYHERISLSDCAAQLNISSDYFRHKFKALTGLSPQRFLLQQRLKASRELLLRSDLSCTEITGRCGFSTPAQFSMLFRQEYSITPQRFRRESSENEVDL